MLGTEVPIHRHEDTSETNICIKGLLGVVFYDLMPDESFEETHHVSLDPSSGRYDIHIPQAAWHTVIVHEPSIIFEGKDKAYKPR